MNRSSMIARGALVAALVLGSQAALAESAADLRSRLETLQARGEPSPFPIPLFIESSQTEARLAGDIHSRLDKPFEAVRSELAQPRAWCEILILHPNVKGCGVDRGDKSLTVKLGSAEAPATFGYELVRSSPDYLQVRLTAAQGPFGTTDYRFVVEAAPLGSNATVLHLGYSHGYGTRAKLALQTYFSTFGRDKVGFTVVKRTSEGQPVYVDDLRGGLERNAMRYYLAIKAHLESQSAPEAKRLETALAAWLRETERHPRQLKEESGFLERKRGEIRRYVAERPNGGGGAPSARAGATATSAN